MAAENGCEPDQKPQHHEENGRLVHFNHSQQHCPLSPRFQVGKSGYRPASALRVSIAASRLKRMNIGMSPLFSFARARSSARRIAGSASPGALAEQFQRSGRVEGNFRRVGGRPRPARRAARRSRPSAPGARRLDPHHRRGVREPLPQRAPGGLRQFAGGANPSPPSSARRRLHRPTVPPVPAMRRRGQPTRPRRAAVGSDSVPRRGQARRGVFLKPLPDLRLGSERRRAFELPIAQFSPHRFQPGLVLRQGGQVVHLVGVARRVVQFLRRARGARRSAGGAEPALGGEPLELLAEGRPVREAFRRHRREVRHVVADIEPAVVADGA